MRIRDHKEKLPSVGWVKEGDVKEDHYSQASKLVELLTALQDGHRR